jgi:hypothetical protein
VQHRVIPIGALAIGVLAIGVLAIGVLAIGVLAIGVLAWVMSDPVRVSRPPLSRRSDRASSANQGGSR